MLKIGIDIRALGGKRTGIGRYIIQILTALARIDRDNQYRLFYNSLKSDPPSDIPNLENFNIVHSRFPNKFLDFCWSNYSFPSVERFTGELDVFHSPHYQMAPTSRAAGVLTVYDITFIIHPELAIPSAVKNYGPRLRRYLERAKVIVTISKDAASDIINSFDIAPEKVEVIYPGATPLIKSSDEEVKRIRKKYGIKGNYILFIGTIEPRKNLVRLIKAFDISDLSSDFQLVLAGPKGWSSDGIYDTWRSSKCADRIVWTDYVDNEDIAPLYSGAAFFAYPSLKEGFGLPVLEAMSVGCPVLTSNTSAMPEAAGDAALYVDPNDVDSIAEGLAAMAGDTDLRKRLSDLGFGQAALFDWDKSAKAMLDIYKKASELR